MQIKFVDTSKEGLIFFSTLRQRVDQYFREQQVSKHGNSAMTVKTLVLLAAYIVPFSLLLVFNFSGVAAMPLWLLMGLALAGIGMSVMHDANHDAYSSKTRINFLLGHTLNLLGGSVFNWKLQHNILHHTYTNILHKDDDIEDKVVFRFSPHKEARWYHRFQHIYAFAFYGITSLYWVSFKDFTQFFRFTRGGVNASSKKENVVIFLRIIFIKLFYFSLFFVLPIAILNISLSTLITGFLLMHFVAGIVLTVIFQLAHTVEGTSHPLPCPSGHIENAWAVHQLQTTVNFSPRNKWLSWYIGGLNFQIEHHLFPTICHIHYPHIAPIVKKTAAEFGIPYLEHPNFAGALRSHVRALKKFGSIPSLNEAIA